MRKREIHSVAHWAMMFLLLMFPILMVGLSVFQHYDASQQETVTIYDDELQMNRTYEFIKPSGSYQNFSSGIIMCEYFEFSTSRTDVQSWFDNNVDNLGGMQFLIYNQTSTRINFYSREGRFFEYWVIDSSNYYIKFYTLNSAALSDNFYFVRYEVVDNNNYKNDVNLWTRSFIDLPINSWYKSLMTVIGVGFTNSSVMNVIYVMPVYILWVFIFDVIVDCFLVIIKLPHKLLNRLSGGENE